MYLKIKISVFSCGVSGVRGSSDSASYMMTHFSLLFFHLIMAQDCPEEVFLEGLLQPSLERGRLGTLQGIMEKLDPGLEACSRYLIASCQFLQRRGYYNTLYQLQQFMMVRVFNVFILNILDFNYHLKVKRKSGEFKGS